jgi:hypothetical protein
MSASDTRYDRAVAMSEPDPRTGALVRAVEHLEAGAWQAAHAIVQDDDSTLAAWLHGIVHTLEGDLGNARYWYRRAGRPFPGRDAVQQELAAARRSIEESSPRGD